MNHPGRKGTFVAFLGHLYEHFESSIFTFCGVFVALYFFPEDDSLLSQYGVYIAISSGFLMAPFGALIFSWIGDTWGRRPALITAYTVAIVPSLLIPFIPSYKQIGVFSSLLIIICRLIQGTGTGGSFAGRIIFLNESTPLKKNLNMGLLLSMGFWGALLGTALSAYFMQDDIIDWGWKVPYVIAAIMGVSVLMLRKQIHETEPFMQQKTPRATFPLYSSLKDHPKEMLVVLLLGMALLMPFYVVASWLGHYYEQNLGLSPSTILTTTSELMIVCALSLIISSALLSANSVRNIILAGTLLLLPLTGFFYYALAQKSLMLLTWTQYATAVHLGILVPPLLMTAPNLFPVKYRYSGFAVPFAVGQAVATGTAPLMAQIISNATGNPSNVAALFLVASSLLFAASLIMKTLKSKETPESV